MSCSFDSASVLTVLFHDSAGFCGLAVVRREPDALVCLPLGADFLSPWFRAARTVSLIAVCRMAFMFVWHKLVYIEMPDIPSTILPCFSTVICT